LPDEGFRVKPILRSWFRKLKSRIERRLDKTHHADNSRPAFTARNPDYEVSHRDHAIAYDGIGAIQLPMRSAGLPSPAGGTPHLVSPPTDRQTP
jgi:hypothetical protein